MYFTFLESDDEILDSYIDDMDIEDDILLNDGIELDIIAKLSDEYDIDMVYDEDEEYEILGIDDDYDDEEDDIVRLLPYNPLDDDSMVKYIDFDDEEEEDYLDYE